MVSVTSVLAPRLSKLIIDGDLDMKGYGILNAVLKAGNKLGADLDAQGKALINAVLGAGVKLGADLDAQGKTVANVILGSGTRLGADLDAQGKALINAVLGAGTKLGADLDAQGRQILNPILAGAPKLAADLDAQGKTVVNAVLGSGVRLGANLDAQGKTVINAAFFGARLAGPLDAAGNKITNLVHDDADPSSGATMAALLDAIYPSILYNKYLCWDAEETPPLLASGYVTGPRRILNVMPDYGILARSKALETANTIVYYYDKRHSHDLDTQDLTILEVSRSTPTEVLKYDYGAVLSVKEVYMILSLWVSGETGTLTVEISSDGSTWTKMWETSTTSNSETIYRPLVRNVSFRYLRFMLVNSIAYTTSVRVKKIVITI